LEDYNKVLARPEAPEIMRGDPYQRAFEAVMLEAVKLMRKQPGRNMMAFVHDDGPDFDVLRALCFGSA
jgi:hypothetical protein